MAIREKTPEASNPSTSATSAGEWKNVVAPFRRAVEEYMDAVMHAWNADDVPRRMNDAWASATANATAPADPGAAAAQHAAVASAVQEAWAPQSFIDAVNEAFTRLGEATKAAWREVDPATLTFAELSSIAGLLQQAATFVLVPIPRRSDHA